MRFNILPKSITFRIVLLIILIFLANVALTWIFSMQYTKKAEIKQTVQTVRAIVSHLSANESLKGIEDILEEGAIVQRTKAPKELRPAHFPMLHAMAERFNRKHESKIDFYNSGKEPGYVWVYYHSPDNKFQKWLGVPRSAFQEGDPYFIFAQEFIIVFLIVIGSLLVARSIQKPLQRLSDATRKFGAGEMPERVKEAGPQEVKDLARSFNRMLDDVKNLERERELMLAGISHDLRTPLTRLQLCIEMIPNLDDETREELKADIKQITEMQQQFIDYIASGVTEEQVETNINELIYHTISKFEHQVKEPIQLEMPTDPIYISISPISISRVINNLVVNAMKYGEEPIKVKLSLKSDAIKISVIDKGEGVALDQQEDIFRPLFRGEHCRRNAEGSGLGLAIVKRIVEKHNGTIKVSDSQGKGFAITFTLPLAQP